MMLMLCEMIKRHGNDDLLFFQTAYLWRYGKQVDVWGDILAWRTQRIIPRYVSEYMHANANKQNTR